MEIVHRPGTSSSYDAIVSDGNLEVGHLNIAEPCTGIAFGSSGDHEAATAIVRARMTGQRPAPIPLRLGGAASNNASPEVCSNSPRHVDQVTLYRGMLTVGGWAKSGPPIVLYDGEPVSAWQSYPVSRPDVAQAYGPAALEWGLLGSSRRRSTTARLDKDCSGLPGRGEDCQPEHHQSHSTSRTRVRGRVATPWTTRSRDGRGPHIRTGVVPWLPL